MLTPKQRQFLKSLAHSLSPIVRVEVDDGSKRREIAEELARAADAEVAGRIGKLAILYRRREEKPKIKLP
ncbi:MAG: hypothetical protein DMF58_00080 [Acidobacteria bacterium]|nr:MAG: hypothetical protein DMF58_00080 [Acidobacteriota bacterium]